MRDWLTEHKVTWQTTYITGVGYLRPGKIFRKGHKRGCTKVRFWNSSGIGTRLIFLLFCGSEAAGINPVSTFLVQFLIQTGEALTVVRDIHHVENFRISGMEKGKWKGVWKVVLCHVRILVYCTFLPGIIFYGMW